MVNGETGINLRFLLVEGITFAYRITIETDREKESNRRKVGIVDKERKLNINNNDELKSEVKLVYLLLPAIRMNSVRRDEEGRHQNVLFRNMI